MNGIFVAMTVMNWTFAWRLQRRFRINPRHQRLGHAGRQTVLRVAGIEGGRRRLSRKTDAALHRSFAHRGPAGRRIEKRAFTDIF